jgi:3-methyladenine DNA glycosylase/8-oxoguanine DNA glycosylase
LTLETVVRPQGPYVLRLCCRLAGDGTRTFEDGRLTAAVDGTDGPELAHAWQRPDGRVVLRAATEQGLEQLRFCLALDADHREFLRRFERDPLVGPTIRMLPGLRPIRTATVAQALLRALCGQLILAKDARAIERRVVRSATPQLGGTWLHAPPSTAALAAFSGAELRAFGLHSRRGATLLRLCRTSDLDRLRDVPTAAAAARLERERGLGPWSVGLVCLEGLGRFERGLARDLGLVKLVGALRGRRAEPEETDELLELYGEWAGLASVYLLGGLSRGLVPVPARRAA